MDIKQALECLDPANDEHWTAEGLPRVDAISDLVGKTVVRQEIVDAAPDMDRTTVARATAEATEKAQTEVQKIEEPARLDDPVEVLKRARTELRAVLESKVAPDVLEVLRDADKTDERIRTLDRQAQQLVKLRTEIDEHAKGIHQQIEGLERVRERRRKSDPNGEMAPIRAHLEAVQKHRAERARRMRGFQSGPGGVHELLKELDPRAPLDRVMTRETGFGGKRPAPQAPPQVASETSTTSPDTGHTAPAKT